MVFSFDIEADARKQLMEGLDEIDQTLQYESDITRFEQNHEPYGLIRTIDIGSSIHQL